MLEDYPNSFDIEPLFLKRFKPVVLLLTKIPNIFKKDHYHDAPWRSYSTGGRNLLSTLQHLWITTELCPWTQTVLRSVPLESIKRPSLRPSRTVSQLIHFLTYLGWGRAPSLGSWRRGRSKFKEEWQRQEDKQISQWDKEHSEKLRKRNNNIHWTE